MALLLAMICLPYVKNAAWCIDYNDEKNQFLKDDSYSQSLYNHNPRHKTDFK